MASGWNAGEEGCNNVSAGRVDDVKRPYIAGFLWSDLNSLLDRFPWFVSGLDCLFTSIDSGPSTADILRHDLPFEIIRTLGSLGIISGDLLLSNRDLLLTGFDELYVLRPDTWRNLDGSLWSRRYTTDVLHLTATIPDRLASMLTASKALRYASDGDGLNVIVSSQGELDKIYGGLLPSLG